MILRDSRSTSNLSASEKPSKRPEFDLAFERCEPRNMLAGVSVLEVTPPALFPAQQHLILDHLADQFQTRRIDQNAADLQLVDVEHTWKGTTAVYQRTIDQLPVHGSYISVVLGNDGNLTDSIDQTFSSLVVEDSQLPHLTPGQATWTAAGDFPQGSQYDATTDLVWFRSGDRAELAWEVRTEIAGEIPVELVSVVDANSGDLLSQTQAPTVVESLVKYHEDGIFPRIVINDIIGAQGSRDYAAPFDAVAALALGCTGTLIAPDVVLSARHCGAGAGSTILFGDNSGSPVFSATVQSSELPAGGGSLLDGGDVAILTLTGSVPGTVATPMQLIDETSGLVGQVAATLGYGYNGLGSVGHGNTADGFRWGGENTIDVYGTPASQSGSNIISTDFDNGTITGNTIPSSSPNPLQYEATTAPGDSGGPIVVQLGGQWVIGGVLSGGTTSNSVYGDISWWTGTAIYKSEIEAAGGVFAGSGLGNVTFDQSTYLFGDTLAISVSDSNGVNPLSVTVESDSGDVETLVLTDGGSGVFTGSLASSSDPVSAGDGTLQAASGDVLTVTYNDPDDGTGNPAVSNDTAVIFEPGSGALVGVDFDQSGGAAPVNWGSIPGGSDSSFLNLIDESGAPTVIDLAVAELTDGSWFDFAVTPAANTIPQHPNALANIDGQIYTGADPLQLTFSELDPLADYEVYVMAAEGFYTSIDQRVTIAGDGSPLVFDQSFGQNVLFVNDQLGDDTRTLAEYAQVVTSTGAGEIVVNVDPLSGTNDVVLAGVAIFKVPEVDLIDPLASKFLDGAIVSGSLADAQSSDDVYFQLNPNPTSNPVKQKIDTILLGEYTGGSLSSFEFTLEANFTGGAEGDVIQTIQMWNETDKIWELLDSRAATSSDSVVTVAASGDLSRFVHPLTSEIIARVGWASPSFGGTPFSWSVNVDQFGWNIS